MGTATRPVPSVRLPEQVLMQPRVASPELIATQSATLLLRSVLVMLTRVLSNLLMLISVAPVPRVYPVMQPRVVPKKLRATHSTTSVPLLIWVGSVVVMLRTVVL